jgi:hypothetical protein
MLINVAALSAIGIGFVSLIVMLGAIMRLWDRNHVSLRMVEEDEASQDERGEEKRRMRKESVLTELNVKEWSLDNTPAVESTEGDEATPQDTPPSGEVTGEAPQPPTPVPPINSSLASCAIGSDDCESSVDEEEMAGCAICLSHFKPQQLVCESNNSLCQHVFHKECMVDWLTNHHDNCPMCREVYLLKTVEGDGPQHRGRPDVESDC